MVRDFGGRPVVLYNQKQEGDWKAQIERQVNEKMKMPSKSHMARKKEIMTNPEFDANCNWLIKVMIELESIWYGHAGCTSITKHHIKIT